MFNATIISPRLILSSDTHVAIVTTNLGIDSEGIPSNNSNSATSWDTINEIQYFLKLVKPGIKFAGQG